jgi:hypothetical protein
MTEEVPNGSGEETAGVRETIQTNGGDARSSGNEPRGSVIRRPLLVAWQFGCFADSPTPRLGSSSIERGDR